MSEKMTPELLINCGFITWNLIFPRCPILVRGLCIMAMYLCNTVPSNFGDLAGNSSQVKIKQIYVFYYLSLSLWLAHYRHCTTKNFQEQVWTASFYLQFRVVVQVLWEGPKVKSSSSGLTSACDCCNVFRNVKLVESSGIITVYSPVWFHLLSHDTNALIGHYSCI